MSDWDVKGETQTDDGWSVVESSVRGAKTSPGVKAALQYLMRNHKPGEPYTAYGTPSGRMLNAAAFNLPNISAGLSMATQTALQRAVPGGKDPNFTANDMANAYRILTNAETQSARDKHPYVSTAIDIGGSLAMPGANAVGKYVVGETIPRLAAAGMKIPARARLAATGRASLTGGALTGTASGMQAAPGEDLKDAQSGAVTGALMAPVMGLVAAGVTKAAPVVTRVVKRAFGKGESAMESSGRKISVILRKAGVLPANINAALAEWRANGVSPNFIDIVKTSGALPDVMSMIRKSGPTAESRRLAEKYATETVGSVRGKVIDQAKTLPTGEARTPSQISADIKALTESATAKAEARKATATAEAEARKAAAAAELEAKTRSKAEREAAGEKVQSATAKWAADMKAQGAALITQAEEKVAGLKLPIADTQAYLDKQIETLGRNPEANRAKIATLSRWKADLENNVADLSALRDLKSSVYETKSPEGLEAGPMAKLRADFSHALDDDIRKGLDAAGEATPAAREALDLYDQASKVFTERYDVMDKVGKKVLGSKVETDTTNPDAIEYTASNAPEKAADFVRSLAKDDHRGFQTLMDIVDPETQTLAREHVISTLGRDSKGVVDPVRFVAETKALPAQSREFLFGAVDAETPAHATIKTTTSADEALAAETSQVDDALAAETADPNAQAAALDLGKEVLTKSSEAYAPAAAAMDTAHTPVRASGAKQAVIDALESGEADASITGLTSPKVTQNLTTEFGEAPVTELQTKAKALSEQGGNARDLAGITGTQNPDISPLVESASPYDFIDPRRGLGNVVLRLLGKNDRMSPKEVNALIARLTQDGSAGASDVLPRLIKKYSKTPRAISPFLTRPLAQTQGDDMDALKETYGIE